MHGNTSQIDKARSLSRRRIDNDDIVPGRMSAAAVLKETAHMRQHEAHSSSARRLGAVLAQQPPTKTVAAAAATLRAAVNQATQPKSARGAASPSRFRSESPAPDAADDAQAHKWRSRCNRDIQARQEAAIQKLVERKNLERARQDEEETKRQRRALRSKSYLLSNIKDPDLKCHVERSSKPGLPRMLPRLPQATIDAAAPKQGRSTPKEKEACRPSIDTASPAESVSTQSPAGGSNHSTQSCDSEITAAKADIVVEELKAADAKEVKDSLPHEILARNDGEELENASPDAASKKVEPGQQGAAERGCSKSSESAKPPKPSKSAEDVAVPNEQQGGSKPSEALKRLRGSVQSFIDRQRSSLAAKPCSNMADWKRQNQCPADQKVFVCTGGYPDFRDALLRRGWFQNPDKNSVHFDAKWGMTSNIDHEHLQQHQIVNHFDKCRDLTTKVGLTLAIRSSVPLSGTEADSFYPRAFDLYDPGDRADFVLDYKLTKAESILRRFLEHVEAKDAMTFSQDVIYTALKVCVRMVTDVDDVIDCEEMAEGLGTVPTAEWKILKKVNLDNVLEEVEKFYTKAELEELINKKVSTTGKTSAAVRAAEKEKEKEKEKKKPVKKKKKKETEEVVLSAPLQSYDCPKGQHYITRARETLAEMEAKNQQHCINGSRNAWIVKPSGKSRGRGIEMLRDLDEIFRTTESDGFQWICQKYIERPQLIHGYKFDIRQWVLVTDWNPLTFYIWKQPYIRFAGQKYDSSCEDRNAYMHLVNNSILKYMDGFEKVNEDLNASGYMWFRQYYEKWLHDNYCKCEKHHTPWVTPPPYTCETFGVRFEDVKFVAKDEDEDDDDDKDQDDFCPPAAASSQPAPMPSSSPQVERCEPCEGGASADGTPACENLWTTSIKPQIQDIILASLRCVSDSVQHRKNTTELFGYDFMLSSGQDKPKVWLIEVNSSPACDYSTPVTCPLVKQMMEDTVKVMVDMRDNPDVDTGEWELIHHEHGKPVPSKKNCPINLEVCGTRIKRPKTKKKKKGKKKQKKSSSQESKNVEEEEDEDDADEDDDASHHDECDDEAHDSADGEAESDSDS